MQCGAFSIAQLGPAAGRIPATQLLPTPHPGARQVFRTPGFSQPVQHSDRCALIACAAPPAVKAEADVDRMTPFLDSLKWDSNGLVVAIAQHVDTGEVLMQAFADRAAINETLQTGYARRHVSSHRHCPASRTPPLPSGDTET